MRIAFQPDVEQTAQKIQKSTPENDALLQFGLSYVSSKIRLSTIDFQPLYICD